MTSTPHAKNSLGGSERASTTETTAPTFHGFPKLPPELRFKIWKAACLPRTYYDHGIHYVSVDVVEEDWRTGDVVALDKNLEGYDEEFDMMSHAADYITLKALNVSKNRLVGAQTTTNHRKESAYLWDAGLWTACRESRYAINEHQDIDGWLQVYNRTITGSPDDFWDLWYHKNFPSTIVPHKKDTPWRPIVAPRSDIFCITASALGALPRTLYGMRLLSPFLGQRNFTVVEDWNIAFKFDSSWNIGFPDDSEELKQENSRRGLLANWVDDF
ncbi:hypothetical protein FSPOR_1728 [Fusarium sporotrichioides]|uniref:2EXR domain-containing protein n=1 Tax=Fusarium sporotrichioides TaxID=5514 RepID=A0A395SNK2_FUSSP|nr:hypothetical protein FSPOR_1728 [Fusarium sporotrichioides]